MRVVLTLAVDTYDRHGRLIGSVLAARASDAAVPAQVVLDAVVDALPAEWSQMSYDALVDHFAATRPTEAPWQQLSIF